VCTWREAERVLAGFPDDLADEGPAGGPPTLVGLQIARENQWTAPGSGRRQLASDRSEPSGGTARTKDGAVSQADTSRAETETTVEQSGADTVGEDRRGQEGSS
jgi:NADH-quinone oxidoreductase subunit E